MLALGIGAHQVKPYLSGYESRLIIACHNSPRSVTVSGDSDAIDELKSTLDTDGVFARIVRTGGQAYHSHHMEPIASKYFDSLQAEISMLVPDVLLKPRVPMFSTVTGEILHNKSIHATYWVKNLNSPVLFNQAMQKMLSSDLAPNIVVEIGPHATFAEPMRQICAQTSLPSVTYLPTLKRNKNDHVQLLNLAGELWARSVPINTAVVTCEEQLLPDGSIRTRSGKLLVDLPPYQWTYTKQLWAESRSSREHRFLPYPRHDILGRIVVGTSTLEPVWRNVLRHQDLPWLKHHSVS